MNYLWGGMILLGILYGTASGNLQEVAQAAVDSSKEAVSLCIVMAGVTSLWVGIMRIAEHAGLIDQILRKFQPVMAVLFPELPDDHPAGKHIAVNMIANFLGLGWAATPAGLLAMEQLADLEQQRRAGAAPGPSREPGTAGNEMCTFLILNISSLQLIPVSIIAYRSQYGSSAPTAIVGPAIAATAVSTAAAVLFCRLMQRRGH